MPLTGGTSNTGIAPTLDGMHVHPALETIAVALACTLAASISQLCLIHFTGQ